MRGTLAWQKAVRRYVADPSVSSLTQNRQMMLLRNNATCPANGPWPHPVGNPRAMDAEEDSHLGRAAQPTDDRSCRFHSRECSEKSYVVKRARSDLRSRRPSRIALPFAMFSAWIRQAIEFAGLSQAELARKINEAVGGSLDRAAVNKMVAGTRDVSATEMLAVAKLTGFPIPMEMPARRQIQIVGFASAGSDEVRFNDAQGPFDEVDAPAWANDHTVAVRIRGTSLGMLFDGWIAFYDDRKDPPDESLLGRVCICGLANDRVVIKKLRAGSARGLYHLESTTEGTLFDVEVEWAALVRSMEQPK